MAYGTQLREILDRVRAEARLSAAPHHNRAVREGHILEIRREQERLYDEVNWPHLRVKRLMHAKAGQRYYSLPDDMDRERLDMVEVLDGRTWRKMQFGIGNDELSTHQSDLGERSFPPRAWDLADDQAIEIWPIPDRDTDPLIQPATDLVFLPGPAPVATGTLDGVMRLTGSRKVRPLVSEDDRADLDDTLIVLFVAAKMLLAAGAKDAQVTFDMATKHMSKLVRNQSKSTTKRMFGVGQSEMPRRFASIDRYR